MRITGVIFCCAAFYVGAVSAQTEHYVALDGANTAPYSSWATAARSISNALAESVDGDIIWVADGRYLLSGPVTVQKGVQIQGTNAGCGAIVDGQNSTRCFQIAHEEAFVANMTMVNGWKDTWGGGVIISGGGTVSNCVIISNTVDYADAGGGGVVLVNCGGVLTHCTVAHNSVQGSGYTQGGGVLVWDGGDVKSCAIYANQALSVSNVASGGGLYVYGSGTANNCEVYENEAEGYGAGAALAFGGVLKDCVLSGNRAAVAGGGVSFYSTNENSGAAEGVVCVSNSAPTGGGMHFFYGGSATNCTVIHNSAAVGGGAAFFAERSFSSPCGIMQNCILSFNEAENYYFSNDLSQYLSYCLTESKNPYFNGAGNVIGSPLFETDSVRLRVDSLGIDQGGGSGAPRKENPLQNYPADGNFDGTATFDIGAYECSNLRDSDENGMPDGWTYRYFEQIVGIDASTDSDGDSKSNLAEFENSTNPRNDLDGTGEWYNGLPLGWRVKYFPTNALDVTPEGDADGDGLSNLDEAIAGTVPTEWTSQFQLEAENLESSGQLKLRWSAAPDRTYQIYTTEELTDEPEFTSLQRIESSVVPIIRDVLIDENEGGKYFRVYAVYDY